MLHIGKRIKEVFDSQPKEYDIDWFASRIPCSPRHLYRIFQKDNIDILLLRRISIILNHDFFQDLSDDKEDSDTTDMIGHNP